jgi:hypothetical protein
VSPVKYELGFYIPEDDILQLGHGLSAENNVAYLPGTTRLQEDYRGNGAVAVRARRGLFPR